ncbi:MAG: DUF1836 domain-containing protein [Clostridia bacterium]|nr:DUF1836 domain-containing protein [Clostridia bacterium]
MNFGVELTQIPGTVLERQKMGGVTGMEFLNKIFFISDGIMLAQIREIAGVDGSTLQNWLKRGWVVNPVNKMYNKEQLSRILIINMLRDTMQLSDISFVLTYVNGDTARQEDDIISESRLYDYICRLVDMLTGMGELTRDTLREQIEECTSDYVEKMSGARRRLNSALEIIILSLYANVIKRHADTLIEKLRK